MLSKKYFFRLFPISFYNFLLWTTTGTLPHFMVSKHTISFRPQIGCCIFALQSAETIPSKASLQDVKTWWIKLGSCDRSCRSQRMETFQLEGYAVTCPGRWQICHEYTVLCVVLAFTSCPSGSTEHEGTIPSGVFSRILGNYQQGKTPESTYLLWGRKKKCFKKSYTNGKNAFFKAMAIFKTSYYTHITYSRNSYRRFVILYHLSLLTLQMLRYCLECSCTLGSK